MGHVRLAGIASYDQANVYLDQHYLAEHNHRYAHAASSAADYHRRSPTRGNGMKSSGWSKSA
jgi:hypothetical protein